jgi:L-fuconolactonase
VEIIDAHHHLWDTRVMRYPLFEGLVPDLNRPYTLEEYERIAAEHGVKGSVLVEAASAGPNGMEEARWLRGQADRSSVVKGLVLWAPVGAPDLDRYLDELASWDDPRIVGIRRSFEFEPEDFPARPEVIEGVRRIARFGWSFDLVLFHPSLPAAAELVRACPEVQFVLDHLGKPPIREGALDPWREHVARLARLPNVACKLSGLVTEADLDRWSVRLLRPYVDHAIECFGWDRLMFGSDWPPCERAGGLGRWLEALGELVEGASADERGAFFSRNAPRVYRIR